MGEITETNHVDIMVTWPKLRPLGSYYAELDLAQARGQVINYRVPRRPRHNPERCYMVHSGFIQCWSPVIEIVWRESETVGMVGGGWWPEGWYVVRKPVYHELAVLIEQAGFRGFHYIARSKAQP